MEPIKAWTKEKVQTLIEKEEEREHQLDASLSSRSPSERTVYSAAMKLISLTEEWIRKNESGHHEDAVSREDKINDEIKAQRRQLELMAGHGLTGLVLFIIGLLIAVEFLSLQTTVASTLLIVSLASYIYTRSETEKSLKDLYFKHEEILSGIQTHEVALAQQNIRVSNVRRLMRNDLMEPYVEKDGKYLPERLHGLIILQVPIDEEALDLFREFVELRRSNDRVSLALGEGY
jgi:hypothetical protein